MCGDRHRKEYGHTRAAAAEEGLTKRSGDLSRRINYTCGGRADKDTTKR